MVALKLDARTLATEAKIACERLNARPSTPLYRLLPRISVQPDWSAAGKVNLDPEKLVRALRHPSEAMVSTATALLLHGAGGAQAALLVKDVIWRAGDILLRMLQYLAKPLWGNEAGEILVGRLEGELTSGCDALFVCLPDVPCQVEQHRL